MTGLTFFVPTKGTEIFEMDSAEIQKADAAMILWSTVMDFMMQILVVALALALGFAVGRLTAAPPLTTAAAARDAAVNTMEYPETVDTHELTMDALRLRLRNMGPGVTTVGNKADLVNRYDAVRRERLALRP